MSQPVFSPGKYWVKVTGQALGKSSNGNPQFVLAFSVMGAVDPAAPEGALLSCASGDRSLYMTITEKTADFVARDLKRLGFAGTSYAQLDSGNPNCHSFIDLEFAAYCTHQEYEGTLREKWGIAKDGGIDVKPLEPQDVRKLDAMFGKHLKTASATPLVQRNPDNTIDGAPRQSAGRKQEMKGDPNAELQEVAEEIPF